MESDAYIWDGTCDDCPYDRFECDVRGRCFMEEDERGSWFDELRRKDRI